MRFLIQTMSCFLCLKQITSICCYSVFSWDTWNTLIWRTSFCWSPQILWQRCPASICKIRESGPVQSEHKQTKCLLQLMNKDLHYSRGCSTTYCMYICNIYVLYTILYNILRIQYTYPTICALLSVATLHGLHSTKVYSVCNEGKYSPVLPLKPIHMW